MKPFRIADPYIADPYKDNFNMPKVSVIIPTYNRAEYLRTAIHSVLSQTFEDFEVIVVDDASTDDTAGVVRKIRDPRVRYIRHDTNKKEAGSRNSGVRSARGEYIAFLDDDDEWLPGKLKLQVELLDNSAAELGGVYTGCITVDRQSGRTVARVVPVKRGDIFDDMLVKNWVGTPSTVILKRECFSQVGLFDQDIAFGVDYDMWIRIANKYHLEYIEQPMVKYCLHSDRLSTNHEIIIRGLENQLKKYSSLFSKNSKGLSRRYLIIGVLYCYNGDLKKGRKALLRAIRINPFEPRHYFNLCASFLGPGNFRRIKDFSEKQVFVQRMMNRV